MHMVKNNVVHNIVEFTMPSYTCQGYTFPTLLFLSYFKLGLYTYL